MPKRVITEKSIEHFRGFLISEEKSDATIKKYIRDVTSFSKICKKENDINRETLLQYKKILTEQYQPASVNSMLASINCYLRFMKWNDCTVKPLKMQRDIFYAEEKALNREEYILLLRTAVKKGKKRLALIMETICACGIRVSELPYITAEAVKRGNVAVTCKGKNRRIFLSHKLCIKLTKYIKETGIVNGSIFVTKNGIPLDRSNIWKEMKALSREAGIDEQKVFPHNLRHLFAVTYYALKKDIAKLADILGHSSINTTRIYIKTSGLEHQKQLEQLRLVI